MRDPSSNAAYHTYDANGNILSQTKYNNGSSLITTSYEHYDSNQLKIMTNKRGATVISSYTYSHYLNGNLYSKDEVEETTTNTTYTYDNMGRLKTENQNNQLTYSYNYDKFGNRKRSLYG